MALTRSRPPSGQEGGKPSRRKWQSNDGEDRYSTEILIVPGRRVQFLGKPKGNGAPAGNGRTAPATAPAAAPADDFDDDIPF